MSNNLLGLSVDAARYSSRHKSWRRTSKAAAIATDHLPSTIKLVTWNIDFSTANPKLRHRTALTHVQHDVLGCKGGERPAPCIILLQEVLREAFRVILDNEWVQKYFVVIPRRVDEWPQGAGYGNVTLVSRSIPVCGAYSIEYDSQMDRNALLVDLKLSMPPSARAWQNIQSTSRFVTLRVANTHLESLPMGAPARPQQLRSVADVLQDEDLLGGFVCGDMNAISPSDIGLAERVGLEDACREEADDEEDEHTWGYQPPCEYPPGRLDKILFSPGGYEVDRPERIGVGVRTDKGQWASDHYGLFTTIRVIAD